MNYGIDIQPRKNTDFFIGSEEIELNPSGDWTDYLPVKEYQNVGLETMACFPKNTQVLMSDFSTKNIQNIKIGESVFTHNGNIRKVTNTFIRNYQDDLLNIRIKGLYNSIIATKEHPFLTTRGWIKTEDLKRTDKVLIPLIRNKNLQLKTKLELETNKGFLWLLGFYLAEGSLGNQKSNRTMITFSISQKETEYANKIIRICKELFDTTFHIYKKKSSFAMDVRGSNIELRNLLEELGGQYCSKKRLAQHLMFIRPSLQLEILKGWLDGDGCYTRKRVITGVSISETLITQMYRILLRNKIKSNLYKRNAYKNHQEAFEIRIYGTEINKVYDKKLKEGSQYFGKKKSSFIRSYGKDFLKQKIAKIEKIKNKNIRVYNLEVEDDNSYIVENVAVHNCVSFSALNCLEILHNRLYGVEPNWSDRFTAKMSNTTQRGNWLTTVANSIRHDGLVSEEDYPSDWTSWENYYQEVPQNIKDKGLDFPYEINYAWIVPTAEYELENALKIAPIQIVVHAWDKQVNGIYQRTEKALNHAVCLFNSVHGEYWEIFDHYDNTIKRLAWDYKIQHGFQYKIKRKNMKFVKLENENAVYLIKGNNAYPISSGDDYLNLEEDWSVVETVSEITQEISSKRLFTFIR